MKIIKKGQTYPVYSDAQYRAFERIKLLVQSWETKSDKINHFLIILLNIKCKLKLTPRMRISQIK